jgi:hypothetical protein
MTDPIPEIAKLRERAEALRRLANGVNNKEDAEALLRLATEMEVKAIAMALDSVRPPSEAPKNDNDIAD